MLIAAGLGTCLDAAARDLGAAAVRRGFGAAGWHGRRGHA
jgi:hypothetical protein